MTMPHHTKVMYLDALPYAQAIEGELGAYLVPSEDSRNIMPGTWQGFDQRLMEEGNPSPAAGMFRVGMRSRVQHVPDRGISMVGDMIGWVLTSLAYWREPVLPSDRPFDVHKVFAGPSVRKPPTVLPIHTPLREYFQTSRDPKLDYRNNDEIMGRAVDLLLEVRTEVAKFVGDDHWVMHYYCRQGLWDYAIEKTVDFRIYDWERRMKSGEWS